MAHAENEIQINKPVQEVYAFLANGLNNPKWRPGVVSIELASGTAGALDALYKQVLSGPGGRRIAGDYVITAAVPDQTLSFAVVAGPARPTGGYYMERVGAGTKLKFVLDYEPKGLAKLMGPMIQKTMDAGVGQLIVLKEVLEHGV
ncbi:MAG TPA: SRPBCC family protein [Patescibacteria group bacterium]|nr:SRPBCC family protein [Patescibacteria group bacterium]